MEYGVLSLLRHDIRNRREKFDIPINTYLFIFFYVKLSYPS